MKDTDLKKQYNEAQKTAFERDARIHQAPVTKRELDARIKYREKLNLVLDFTPDGTTQQTVHHEINSENEQRINRLEERLNRQKGQAKDAFSRSR